MVHYRASMDQWIILSRKYLAFILRNNLDVVDFWFLEILVLSTDFDSVVSTRNRYLMIEANHDNDYNTSYEMVLLLFVPRSRVAVGTLERRWGESVKECFICYDSTKESRRQKIGSNVPTFTFIITLKLFHCKNISIPTTDLRSRDEFVFKVYRDPDQIAEPWRIYFGMRQFAKHYCPPKRAGLGERM